MREEKGDNIMQVSLLNMVQNLGVNDKAIDSAISNKSFQDYVSSFKSLKANKVNILLNIDLDKPINLKAKIRYRSKPAEAVLEMDNKNIATLNFKEPQRAITNGQSVVFYIDENIVLGGGVIL